MRPLLAPSVVVNVNSVHVVPLIDKGVDGPRSGVGLVMVPAFLLFRLGWFGVWSVDFFLGQDDGSHPRNSWEHGLVLFCVFFFFCGWTGLGLLVSIWRRWSLEYLANLCNSFPSEESIIALIWLAFAMFGRQDMFVRFGRCSLRSSVRCLINTGWGVIWACFVGAIISGGSFVKWMELWLCR